jgi:hypothetical protein
MTAWETYPDRGKEMGMDRFKLAMLSPIAWRTPPQHYGPWESVVSLITEGLVERGIDVTLFATGDSITRSKLRSVCRTGYEEDKSIEPKVCESLHIANLFEHADEFDLIHNHFDFLPLTYAKLVSTPAAFRDLPMVDLDFVFSGLDPLGRFKSYLETASVPLG